MLGHGPGDREAVEGGGAAADLIEQHQRALAGVVQDVGGFAHLHHEGGLAAGQVVDGTDPGEDAIGDAEAGGAGRNPAADLRHQLQQARLAQIAALAAGIGAGEHQQIGRGCAAAAGIGAREFRLAGDGWLVGIAHAGGGVGTDRDAGASRGRQPISPQGQIVGGEALLHQQLLHHRMAAGLKAQLPAFHQFRPAIAAGGGHLGQGGEGIEFGHESGGGADRGGLQPHPGPQVGEQLVFPLGGPSPQLQDLPLPSFESRRHEAFLVGEGLAADPVLRYGGGAGPAHGQEVAEGAVVLEPQVGVAAGLAFEGLLFGQPVVLVIELIAQAIQHRIHPVMDQAALTETQRRRLQQLLAQLRGHGGQFRPGLPQGLQRFALGVAHQGGQPRQPLQTIGQGDQIAGGGAAGSGSAGQPLEIAHRPQQPPQGQAQGAVRH